METISNQSIRYREKIKQIKSMGNQMKKKTVHTVTALTQFLHGVAEIPSGDAPRASTVEFSKQPHQFRFAAAGFPNQLRQFVVQDINDVFTASPGQVGWGKEGQWETERRTVGIGEKNSGKDREKDRGYQYIAPQYRLAFP